MADAVLEGLDHVDRVAKEAGLTFEKAAIAIRIDRKYVADQLAARRSTADERDTIEAGVAKMFGTNPNIEKKPREIAAELGVRANQGNLTRISRQVTNLKLTYRTAAE